MLYFLESDVVIRFSPTCSCYDIFDLSCAKDRSFRFKLVKAFVSVQKHLVHLSDNIFCRIYQILSLNC
jgi:hypothetical protein